MLRPEQLESAGFQRAHATRLRIDKVGRIFLPLAFIGLMLGWAAGDLALFFAAFACTVPIIAALWAWIHGRGLQLRALSEPPHFVGQPFHFEIEARRVGLGRNACDVFFSFGESALGNGTSADKAATRGRHQREARPVGALFRLQAGTSARIPCVHRLLRRGLQHQLIVVAHSTYPFSMWRVERSYTLDVEFVAWPRLGAVRNPERLCGRRSEEDERRLRATLEEDEFYQLRQWREGMSLRHVHWKLSARRGRPILQELRGERDAPVHLGLITDLEAPSGTARRSQPSFESAISLVATLCLHFLRRGRRVSLTIHGKDSQTLLCVRGRAGRQRILDALAIVEARPVSNSELRAALNAAAAIQPHGTLVYAGAGLASKSLDSQLAERAIDVDSVHIDALFQRGMAPLEEVVA